MNRYRNFFAMFFWGAAITLLFAGSLRFGFGEERAIAPDSMTASEPFEEDSANDFAPILRGLTYPVWSILLLIAAFVALGAELHSPGFGGFGLVSALCFGLFFGSHVYVGTAGWLELVLFGVGAMALIVEIVAIPGFGLLGVAGATFVLAAILFSGQTFFFPHTAEEWHLFQTSFIYLAIAGVGILSCGWCGVNLLEKRFQPTESVGREAAESRVDYHGLVGKVGVATTALVPGGKAEIEGELVNVLADGEFVPAGTGVIVTEVAGSRVIVHPRTV